jgi:hypothetical protein
MLSHYSLSPQLLSAVCSLDYFRGLSLESPPLTPHLLLSRPGPAQREEKNGPGRIGLAGTGTVCVAGTGRAGSIMALFSLSSSLYA